MKMLENNLWVSEKAFRLFGADFGNRMTVVKLADGGLFVHSPIELDSNIEAGIKSLGPVSLIVTPNSFHGLYVNEWLLAFPEARHITVNGTGAATPSTTLSDSTCRLWEPEIASLHVNGINKLNEYVFFHKQSRTLILTDLVFNVGTDISWWSKVFFRLNDTYGKFGPTRLLRSMVDDREALRASINRILDWNFERIIMSHGHIVEKDGKKMLRNAFARYLISPSNRRRVPKLPSLSRCG